MRTKRLFRVAKTVSVAEEERKREAAKQNALANDADVYFGGEFEYVSEDYFFYSLVFRMIF